MKKSSAIFLQVVIILIGLATLGLLLWEPHLEGRNANATLFEIYFKDPFLIYIYVGSLSFFIGLYQAFKVLEFVKKNKIFSQATVSAFRTAKHCAMILIAFIAGAEGYILTVMRGKDDIAGGVAMGLFMIFIFAIIGTASAVFERILQNAVDIKSENDLTV